MKTYVPSAGCLYCESSSQTLYFGYRCSACREISKIHEESVRGTLSEVAAHFAANEPRGEFVLIVEGAEPPKKQKKKKERTEDEE